MIYVYSLNQLDELKEIPEVYKILGDNKKEQIKLDDESGFEFTNKIISNVDDTISSKGKKEPIKEEKETLDCFGEIDWDDI